jgi:TolA-binding protein
MEWKKIALYFGLPALILVAPFIALSNSAMDFYQRRIDANPGTESAKNWQLRLAEWNRRTMRPERGADMYGLFADRHKEDPRRPDALWLRAMSYEDAGRRHEAIQALVKLANEHPGTPRGLEADSRLNKHYEYFAR